VHLLQCYVAVNCDLLPSYRQYRSSPPSSFYHCRDRSVWMKSFLIASVTVLGSIPLSQLSVSVPGLLLLILFLHQLRQGTEIRHIRISSDNFVKWRMNLLQECTRTKFSLQNIFSVKRGLNNTSSCKTGFSSFLLISRDMR
jgi:hypothetical protein